MFKLMDKKIIKIACSKSLFFPDICRGYLEVDASGDNHVENLLSCRGSESVTIKVSKCCSDAVPLNKHNMTKPIK